VGEALHPRVIIEGNVVRRPAAAWTSTVHSLLRHLRASGVPGIPEPLAINEGEERLRLVPGASGADCWAPQATEQGLRSAARLLRTVHDAARTWIPPTEARWALPPVADADCTICHGDRARGTWCGTVGRR
jgi:hypothetical protein